MTVSRGEKRHILGMLELLKQVGGVHHALRPDLFREGARKYDAGAMAFYERMGLRPRSITMEWDLEEN